VSDLARVASALQAAPSVAVLAHINPEGDAIGSTLAATLALREAGKRTAAFNADPVPPGLRHLPGVCELRCELPRNEAFACYLVLDTSDLSRTGGLLDGRAAEGKGKRCGGKIPWETQISASWAQSSPGTYWRKELGLPRKVRTGSRKLKGPRSRTPRAQRSTVSAQAMYLRALGMRGGRTKNRGPYSIMPSEPVVYSCHSGHQRASGSVSSESAGCWQ